MRRGLCGAAICGLILAVPAIASGDGLPVQGVDAGATGVTRAGAGERYVTLPAGRRRTVVARIASDGGEVLQSIALGARFTIPAVALDGSVSGLSADGSTLALIRPRVGFPQRRTRLALLDTGRLRLRGTVTLRGDFSFDAVSPDGRSVYLIEYLSRRDPTRYAVRVYDTAARRLLRKPIVDPREPDERMRGMPITRATSPDGRWAYTLYDGAGEHPFVHALDTVARTAACIDLDALAGDRHLYQLRLGLAGRELRVVDGIDAVAAIDRTTFRVGEPAAAAPPRPAPARAESGGDGPPWTLLASAAVALLLGVGTALRMRPHDDRRHGAPTA
jgi:hypothetical protein